jgi:hypothetical protein
MINKLIFKILLIVLAVSLSACSLPSSTTATGRGFAFIWYVATDGDDSNSCLYPDDACLTIKEAITKSEAQDSRLAAEHDDLLTVEHTINVGPGIYREDESTFPIQIQNNVSLVGAGRDSTIINAEHLTGGVQFSGQAIGSIENLTIRNGRAESVGACITLMFGSEAIVQAENVTVLNCPASGIVHGGLGLLTLTNVRVTRNGSAGLMVRGDGETIVRSSEIDNNGNNGIDARSIRNNLSVSDSLIRGNELDGIFSGGTINILRSTISNNGSGVSGYGLYIFSGTATVSESNISNNHILGVGVESGAVLTIDNSTVEGNRSGGLDFDGDGTILRVTVRDNGRLHAGTSTVGAVYVSGTLRIQDSIIQANHSGGILVGDTGNLTVLDTSIDGHFNQHPGVWNFGTADIQYSTISNNVDNGIDNRGTMSIANSTLSGNGENGVTAVEGELNLSFVTIANNRRNGLNAFRGSEHIRSVFNVLISGNENEDCGISSGPGITPFSVTGNNLDSDNSCPFDVDFREYGIITDLMIGPLADNGGRTFTHALLPGSPAIDAATGACPSTDQTHTARPMGLSCDVGAYEASFETLSLEGGDFVPPTANKDTLCLWGPGPEYGTVNAVDSGTQVILLGVGQTAGWLIIETPVFPGVPCWADQDDFDLDPDIDLNLVPVFPVPPLPETPPDDGGDATTKPAAPTNLKAATTCEGFTYTVKLTWNDNSNNESGFRIYRNGTLLATVGLNTTTYTDNSPPGNGPQNYTVRAFNSVGNSATAAASDNGCMF